MSSVMGSMNHLQCSTVTIHCQSDSDARFPRILKQAGRWRSGGPSVAAVGPEAEFEAPAGAGPALGPGQEPARGLRLSGFRARVGL